MRPISATSFFAALVALGSVVNAKWTIDETTCGKKGTEKYDFITQEMPIVVKAAQVTAAGFQGEFGNAYYELLMPASKRRLRGFPAALKQIFTNIANAADETSTFIDYKIKCDNTGNTCKGGVFAWNDGVDVNLCDILTVKSKRSTKPITKTGTELASLDAATRDKFFLVANSVTGTLLHELTHFAKVMVPVSPKQRSLDYAYGYYDSVNLATGTYDRMCYVNKLKSLGTSGGGASSHVMCPKSAKEKTTEGICPEARALQNADNYRLIALPTYWSTQNKKLITPPTRKAAKREHARGIFDRATCPSTSDGEDIMIDWIMEDPVAESTYISA